MLGGAVGNAFAQANLSTESAQELIRQQERERALRQQQEQTPSVRLERPLPDEGLRRFPEKETPCFPIQHIALNGEAADRFQWILMSADVAYDGSSDPATGRCLGTSGISLIMKRIQNALIERGFVTTRVLAQPQDLNSGTLTLTLFPGRVHSIRFAGDDNLRATKWNAVPVRSGDILNLRDIEQALENFKRVPTADADIQITPAEGADVKPGDSDLVIAWKQGFPFRLSASLDDSGTKATGKYQGSFTLSYDHFLTLNDLFYASINHDLGGGQSGQRGTRGYTVHYSLPFGYWLLGFTGSSYNYHQEVAGTNQSYLYSGDSRSNEIKLSRVVYRDAVRKTTLFLSGWQRASNNYIDDTEIEVQRRRTAGWDAGIAHREFIGNNVLDMSAGYRRGTGALDSLPAPEEAIGEGSSRTSIVNASAQLNVPFSIGSQRLYYSGAWRGQWARTALVPQDRFSVGGRYTVRGFDGENVLLADSGWFIRNEIGMGLGGSGQQAYLGVDYGEVSGPSSRALIGTYLSGAVIGLRGAVKGLSYDLFMGQPLSKPKGFQTASTVAGFNLNWTF